MRRRRAPKREITPDAKYNSELVAHLIHTIMERGKKSVAQSIVYGALDEIKKKKKEMEQQRIRIRLETRKFGKATTIIDGMDDKNSNLSIIAQKLKTYCACGGTHKNGQIMLQGDHRDRVREFLVKMGYPQENIELQ